MNDSKNSKRNPSDFDKLDLRSEEVFINLYDYFAPKLLKHAYIRLSSNEEAKDVVAQIFMKTWEYLREQQSLKRPIKNVRAFLYRLTNNQIIDLYRKKSKTEVSLENLEFLNTVFVDTSSILESQYQFDAENVMKVAGLLRGDYKKILIWRYLDELNIGEISEILGKSKGAVSVMLYRALRDLKRILKERGF